MSSRILLVEDEPGMLLALSDRLGNEGYQVDCEADGKSGLYRALAHAYDLIILDIMLPKQNGYEVCRGLRERGVKSAVLMLTARDSTADKVKGLSIGADDYLTKPFDSTELLARIGALLRRSPSSPDQFLDSFSFGNVTVKFRSAEVFRSGNHVRLSAGEFKLLKFLIQNRDSVITRDQLLNIVWGYNFIPNTRTVDVHVAKLRQKLEPDPQLPRFIMTVRGMGYRFQKEQPTS